MNLKKEMFKREYSAFKKMVTNDFPYEIQINDIEVYHVFQEIYTKIKIQHSKIKNKFFSGNNKNGLLDFKFLDHYLIFCFRIANHIYKNYENLELCEAIYYSSKIRTNTDLYYTTEIGDYFIPAHSLGTVMDSRAEYGKLFKIYNGVHIGPYNIQGVESKDWKHPKIGDGVTLLANSSVYGKTEIGNNVIVSVGAKIINEKIPNNCVVIGQSPNLFVIPIIENNFDLLDE